VPSRIFHTRSEEETIALGREIAPSLVPGAVLLIGNLGAGKTTLAKGIVEGLHAGSANDVSSPTFTLIHQYGETAPVYHIDLYRLDEQRQVERLGLDDLFNSGSVVLMEWAERFPDLLPHQRTEIRLQTLPDETREITISRVGQQENGT
jgi:tRNA threonylcarbamoyladenosine biosynthesis protein TsaE